eukprot:1311810-Alexandrium_andersonii.AAC.1
MPAHSSRPSRCQLPRSAVPPAAAAVPLVCISQSEGALRSGAQLRPASSVPQPSCKWVLLRPWKS